MNLKNALLLLFSLLACMAPAAQARKLGRTVFTGDSITQGFDSSIYPSSPQASYRYQFWKGLTDNGLVYGRDYTFVGSQQGSCHKGATDLIPALTPAYRKQAFINTHEGHFNWCASYLSGFAGIPAADLQQNRGKGTLRDWLAPSNPSGYAADTVFLMLGTNDLHKGRTTDQFLKDMEDIVRAYQKSNPSARIYVLSITPPSAKAGKAMMARVRQANRELAARAAAWSTGTSAVSYVDIGQGMAPLPAGAAPTPGTMNIDNWHPNNQGELIMSGNLLKALGLQGQSAGLERRASGKLPFTLPFRSVRPGAPPDKLFLDRETAGAWNRTPVQLTLDWKGGADAAHQPALTAAWNARGRDCTLDLSLRMNQPEADAPNHFQIHLGNGKTEGILRMEPDRLSWNGTVLYHADMKECFRNVRITCSGKNGNAGTGSGFRIWLDGQMIGDALPGKEASGEVMDGFRMGAAEKHLPSRAILKDVKFDTRGAFAP